MTASTEVEVQVPPSNQNTDAITNDLTTNPSTPLDPTSTQQSIPVKNLERVKQIGDKIDSMANELGLNISAIEAKTIAVVFIVIGTYMCLIGKSRFFKVFLGLVGAMVGAFLGVGLLLILNVTDSSLAYYASAGVLALIGSVVAIRLWQVAIYGLAGLAGAAVGSVLANLRLYTQYIEPTFPRQALIVLCSLIIMLLVNWFDNLVTKFSCAVVGSCLVMAGIDFWAQQGFLHAIVSGFKERKMAWMADPNSKYYLMVWGTVALAVGSFIFQLYYGGSKMRQEEDANIEEVV